MGNSVLVVLIVRDTGVHPHVHGELSDPKDGMFKLAGSSPRAWGTLKAIEPDVIQLRFIPTCMGNSTVAYCIQWILTVHPHVHGELCTSFVTFS